MDSIKPLFVAALLFVVLVAGVMTYADLQITKRDVKICQLENQLHHTKKKCE